MKNPNKTLKISVIIALAIIMAIILGALFDINSSKFLSKQLVASDGNNYKITVGFSDKTKLPNNIELVVNEIENTDDNLYKTYFNDSIRLLKVSYNNIEFARAFDISLYNKENNEEYQPEKELLINIELINNPIENDYNINVIHFGNKTEVVDTIVKNKTVSFGTQSLSVYMVIGTNTFDFDSTNPLYDPSSNANKFYIISNGFYLYVKNNGIGTICIPELANLWEFTPYKDGYRIHCDNLYLRRSGTNFSLTNNINSSSIFKLNDLGDYHQIYNDDADPILYLGYNNGFKAVTDTSYANLVVTNGTEIYGDFILFMKDSVNKYGAMQAEKGATNVESRAVLNITSGGYTWDSTHTVLTVTDGYTEPTVWNFTKAKGDGLTTNQLALGHYISTEVNGETKYLNLGSMGGTNVRAPLTLEDTPQVIYVSVDNQGRVRLSNSDGFSGNLGSNQISNNRFGSWYGATVGPYEWYYLGLNSTINNGEINTIKYIYSKDSTDAGNPWLLPASKTVITTYDSYTLDSPEKDFYYSESEEKLSLYSFVCWSVNGVECNPGETITISDINTEIYPVWTLVSELDRPAELNYYISSSGYFLRNNANNTEFYKDVTQQNETRGITVICNPATAPMWTFSGVFKSATETGYIIHNGEYYIGKKSDTRWYLTTDRDLAVVFNIEEINDTPGLKYSHIYNDTLSSDRLYLGLANNSERFNTICTDPTYGNGTELTLTPDGTDYSGYYTICIDSDDINNLSAVLMENNTASSTVRRQAVSAHKATDSLGRLILNLDGTIQTIWKIEKVDDGTLPAYTLKSITSNKYLSISGTNITMEDTPCTLYFDTRADGKIRFVCADGKALNLESISAGFRIRMTNSHNEWFDLIETRLINYNYVVANTEDPAPGNLPENQTKVVYYSDYVIEEPSQTSYYYDIEGNSDYRYEYDFDHWVDDNAESLNPGDYYDLNSKGGQLSFTSVWNGPHYRVKPYMVRYNIDYYTTRKGEVRVGVLPTALNGELQEVAVEDATSYTIDDLTSRFYRSSTPARLTWFTHEFRTWKTESGTSVNPGTIVDLVSNRAIYDSNGDKYIDLYTDWVGEWKNDDSTGSPSVKFSIWKATDTAEEQISAGIMLDENVNNYSPTIGNAIMRALDDNGNIIYSDELSSPSRGNAGNPNYGLYLTEPTLPKTPSGKYMMISYASVSIVEADEAIRSLVTEGYVGPPDRTGNSYRWYLSNLPSDEEVMDTLRLNKVKITDANGAEIPNSELTADNFTVRWCHVKYQSGDNDGWNINGKLTRKVSYTKITKTFEASDEIVAKAIENGFNISLINANNTSDVTTLRLVDKTSASNYIEGRIDEDVHNYGYVETIDNPDGTTTYVWMVVNYGSKTYLIQENNYNIEINGIRYGVNVQYNQYNTGNYEDGVKKNWNNTPVSANAQATDQFDETKIIQTNFYNEYIPEGIIQINVQDESGNPVENAQIQVYDTFGNVKTLYYNSEENYYNVLYENTTPLESAPTNNLGTVYIKLSNANSYIIKEIVPTGYVGDDWDEHPQFEVSVSFDGNFYTTNPVILESCGTLEFGEQGTIISHVQITNRHVNSIVLQKAVVDSTAEYAGEPFDFIANVSLNGHLVAMNNIIGNTNTDANNNVEFQLADADGYREVTLKVPYGSILTIEETIDVNYTIAIESENNIANIATAENKYKCTVLNNDTITYTNTKTGVDILFKKIDGFGEPLGNAKFSIYTDIECKDSDIFEVKINGISSNYVTSAETFTTEGSIKYNVSFKLPAGTFYMKEIEAPTDYENNDSLYRIIVGEAAATDNGVTLPTGSKYVINRIRNGYVETPPYIMDIGILNLTKSKSQVILKKIDNLNDVLSGGSFDIHTIDFALVESGLDANESGIFYINELPYGYYYIHETNYPSGVQTNGVQGWWFTIKVEETGTKVVSSLKTYPTLS